MMIEERMRKIALVGTSSSGKQAPYADKSWEIWGVSARADYVSRASRWFELHRLDGEPAEWAAHWRKCLSGFTNDIPELVMMYPEPSLAKKVTHYPYERIADRFGTFFMTSTFSWMMALAIDELRPIGKKPVDGRIAIFGVEMEYSTEYRQQRTGFRHFIDLAKYAGIPVERLVDGGLAYEPVPYPMWQDDPLMAKNTARRKEALEQLNDWDESLERTQTLISCNRGAVSEMALFEKGDYDAEKRADELEREYGGLARTSEQIRRDIAAKRGQFEEQCWLNDYLQP